MPDKPKIRGICETVLYTDSVEASLGFYADVLNLQLMMQTDTMLAFDAGTSQALLVFDRGFASQDHELYGGFIPGHRADGPAHMAFHISVREFDDWKSYLLSRKVAITGEVAFPSGGRSLYFEDPSGNVIELATPGHWPNF
ncbi:MAG: VOC family protein [Paracoccaceae bacterium]